MTSRERYVKPIVMQLHYATDPSVTIALTCKTTTSTSGPTIAGCLETGGQGVCQDVVAS
jgi:hypothetical protein